MKPFSSLDTRMKLKNSLSLKSLIVLGFVVAVIPLFLAVLYAAFGMRETTALARTLNFEVFEQTKTIRLALQKASDIERKARLFVLLSDPAIRQPYEQQSYEAARTAFKQTLDDLLKLDVDSKIALLVNELAEKENLIYQEIITSKDQNNAGLPIDEAFQGLRESSNSLSREFESHVDRRFNQLRRQSESLETGLLAKGGLLLLISFSVIAVLLFIVSRSIRQLDTAIRRLGAGELEPEVIVSGPSDLSYLGNRLEWLRTHLIELETSKQQFMHNVAREIDAPLDNIRQSAELLANQGSSEPLSVRQDIARSLCADIDNLKTVCDEFVRYSQVNNNAETKPRENVDMKALIESVLSGFESHFNAKSITIKKMIRPVEIFGVAEQLKCIVEQLVTNAIKYSPVDGELRIMLRDTGPYMELKVEDEGPGIDPELHTRVFEPFFRGKSESGDKNDGPGLGLAIVKQYVDNHHGRIDIIDSHHYQHGARLRVQIPVAADI